MRNSHVRVVLVVLAWSTATCCAFSSVSRTSITKYERIYPHEKTFEVPPQEATESSARALEAMGFRNPSCDAGTGHNSHKGEGNRDPRDL
jgi:hypothetical protein